MKRLLAALSGGTITAAAAFSPYWSIALVVLVAGVLIIVAGVIFHRRDDPTARVERLIKALRSEQRPTPRARPARTPKTRKQIQFRTASRRRGPQSR